MDEVEPGGYDEPVMLAKLEPIQSLYVHVPFCAAKCEYCAFYSEVSSGALIKRYVAALQKELELVTGDLKPRTIFFGGGTPSILNLQQWEVILSSMDRLGLLHAAEFTVECNPATVSFDKATLLRESGVNRISMGVQSLDETLLDRLGRVHSREMAFKSFEVLRRAGFDNINLDLMFAIPGQTMSTWKATLREAVALGSEHLSSYEVTYEEDTPLFDQLRAGEFDVDEDAACDMYDTLVDFAGAHGFHQYEVSNFARDQNRGEAHSPPNGPPAFACQHNLNYWRGGSFYGLGPSATSYVRGVRSMNWANTQLYCEQLEKGRRAIQTEECLPALRRAGETAAFGLRMVSGLPFAEFQQTTGFDLRAEWSVEMQELGSRGWGRQDSQRFQLTRTGLRFADAAAEMFLR
jgi:oxygen-independent coproporphyrinogen-3 oxidase